MWISYLLVRSDPICHVGFRSPSLQQCTHGSSMFWHLYAAMRPLNRTFSAMEYDQYGSQNIEIILVVKVVKVVYGS